jgi:hypothetical protein
VLQSGFAHGIDIPVDSGRRLKLFTDTFKARRQNKRKCQIGIRGRVRTPQFNAGGKTVRGRNTDERAPVACRPGNVDRGFVFGNQPFIGIDERIGNCGNALDVFHDTGDKVVRLGGKSRRIVW